MRFGRLVSYGLVGALWLGAATTQIATTIELRGDEEGVIVACGGRSGGYTTYIKDGRLHVDYNFFDVAHYRLRSGNERR